MQKKDIQTQKDAQAAVQDVKNNKTTIAADTEKADINYSKQTLKVKEYNKLAKNNQKREKAERNKLNASKYAKKNNRNSRFRNN